VVPVVEKDLVAVVTEASNVLVCRANEINELAGPGRGVTVIKVAPDDRVIAFLCSTDKKAELKVETEKGRKFTVELGKSPVFARGARGRPLNRKEKVKPIAGPPVVVQLPEKAPEKNGR